MKPSTIHYCRSARSLIPHNCCRAPVISLRSAQLQWHACEWVPITLSAALVPRVHPMMASASKRGEMKRSQKKKA